MHPTEYRTPGEKTSGGYSGFPLSHVTFLRCRVDGGTLDLADAPAPSAYIREGALCCRTCGMRYAITEGIVRMLDERELDEEGVHELQIRDEQNETMPDFPDTPVVTFWNELEMKPFLEALDLHQDAALLEFACGAGRYTGKLINSCRALVAVDFSLAALRALARKIPAGAAIGLVQADITRFRAAPRAFDRVLSTTCLDNRDQRMAMHRLAAESLVDEGRYIFGNEFYNLQTRLLGLPKVMRYTPQGMVFCHLEKSDVIREAAPYFGRIRMRPVQVPVPFTRMLPLPVRTVLSRIAERTPVLRNLGVLLLVRAQMPLRMPVEGEAPAGSRIARLFHDWYKKRRGQESRLRQAG